MRDQPDLAFSDMRLRAFVDAVFDAYYDWHFLTGRMEMSAQMDVLLRLRPRRAAQDLRRLVGTPASGRRREGPPEQPACRPQGRESTRATIACVAAMAATFWFAIAASLSEMRRDAPRIWSAPFATSPTSKRPNGRSTKAAELYHALFAQAVNPAYHIAERSLPGRELRRAQTPDDQQGEATRPEVAAVRERMQQRASGRPWRAARPSRPRPGTADRRLAQGHDRDAPRLRLPRTAYVLCPRHRSHRAQRDPRRELLRPPRSRCVTRRRRSSTSTRL